MSIKGKKFDKSIRLKGTTDAATLEGEIRNDSDTKIKAYIEGSEKEVLTDSQTQTVTNKDIDADNNTISNLETDNLKAGVLNTDLSGAATDTEIPSALAVKTALEGQNEASEIDYDNSTSGLAATNVQDAIDEVEGRVDTVETESGTTTGKTDDLVTLSGQPANSTDLGTFTGSTITDNTTVKNALQELETEVETKVGLSETATFTNKTIDADLNTITNIDNDEIKTLAGIDATKIADGSVDNTEYQHLNGVSSNIQTQIDSKASDADLTAHTGASSGVHGVTGNVVGTTDTQVITNKDIDGTTASNTNRITLPKDTKANLDSLTRKEGTIVYSTDDAKAYIDDGSNLIAVGSGSGVGGVNYIENFDFEINADGWTGEAGFNRFRTTSTILRGVASLRLAKGSLDASGRQIYTDFTIDSADLAKKLTISFDKDFTEAAADGDFIVKIIQDPSGSATEIAVNGAEISADTNVHYAQFQTDHTETDYRLVIEVITTDTTSRDLYIDNVVVGPRAVASSAFMTDWEEFTPTGAFTTNATYLGRYKRIGDMAEIVAQVDFSGTTNTTVFTLDMPTGLVIDTDKLPSTDTAQAVGYAHVFDNSLASLGVVGRVAYNTPNDVYISVENISTSNTMETVRQNVPIVFNSGDHIFIKFSVPIAGWSSNATSSEDLGQRDVVVRASGNSGETLTPAVTNIPFNITEDKDTTASWDGSTFTAPESGEYEASGFVAATLGTGAGQSLRFYINNTEDIYGHLAPSSTSTRYKQFYGKVFLNKGDTLNLRSTSGFTLENFAPIHYINIQKLASPQTILETETVAASYTSNSGQTVSNNGQIVYEDLTFDTHNMYDTSTGIGVAPVSGYYLICASAKQNASLAMFIEVRINGVRRAIFRASADSNEAPNGSVLVEIKKGETFVINNVSGANRTLTTGGAADNFFTIHRIK